MSNRDSDARYEAIQQGVPFFGSELLKRVHTSLPGVVVAYNAATRRARVQPAVDHMVSPDDNPNAEFADLEPMPNPIILDVPVIFPIGGGYTVHFPLLPDDPCFCCSRNGILPRSNRRWNPARLHRKMLWKFSTSSAFRGLWSRPLLWPATGWWCKPTTG